MNQEDGIIVGRRSSGKTQLVRDIAKRLGRLNQIIMIDDLNLTSEPTPIRDLIRNADHSVTKQLFYGRHHNPILGPSNQPLPMPYKVRSTVKDSVVITNKEKCLVDAQAKWIEGKPLEWWEQRLIDEHNNSEVKEETQKPDMDMFQFSFSSTPYDK